MAIPSWLISFGERCKQSMHVETADAGLSITVGDRTVLVDPDRDDAGRVALWIELKAPKGAANERISEAAMNYTAGRFVETGCAMGFNPDARLVLLGRSLDRTALAPGNENFLLDALVIEAGRADAALRQSSTSSQH